MIGGSEFANNKAEKYKLNQVSQHRIQMSIENKKLNKGKKKVLER
jgi:hypothetical protein